LREFLAVSLLLSAEQGLPYLDHQAESFDEPKCIAWSLPVRVINGQLREIPLICCFEKPDDTRRVCSLPEIKW
jgi:hypothetical protein